MGIPSRRGGVVKQPLIIMIGPSGVGKSAVVGAMRRLGLVDLVPTWTTRPRRCYQPVEEDDHVFVSPQEFDLLLHQGFFLETARMFSLPYVYGLPALTCEDDPGCIKVIMLRASLMPMAYKHFPGASIYQVEAPHSRVLHHMKHRSRHESDMGTRIVDFQRELESGRNWADRLIDNGASLDSAIEQMKKYVLLDFPFVGMPS